MWGPGHGQVIAGIPAEGISACPPEWPFRGRRSIVLISLILLILRVSPQAEGALGLGFPHFRPSQRCSTGADGPTEPADRAPACGAGARLCQPTGVSLAFTTSSTYLPYRLKSRGCLDLFGNFFVLSNCAGLLANINIC